MNRHSVFDPSGLRDDRVFRASPRALEIHPRRSRQRKRRPFTFGKLAKRLKTSNRLGLDLGPGGASDTAAIDELRVRLSKAFPYFADSARAGSLWVYEDFVRTLGPNSNAVSPGLGMHPTSLASRRTGAARPASR